jgi:hypothetical protein
MSSYPGKHESSPCLPPPSLPIAQVEELNITFGYGNGYLGLCEKNLHF